jgi:cytochrome c-type biogenesis protein CcmH/NrfG
MNFGQIFWFTAGVLSTFAVLVVVYPWLAARPRVQLLAALPRWAPLVAIAAVVGALGLYLRLGSPQLNVHDSVASASGALNSVPMAAGATSSKSAGSMDSAVTGLEKRLAAGGGNDGDWELLAKSYEFLGRTEDAALARRKQLPAGAGSGAATPGAAPAAPAAVPMSAAGAQLLAEANAARAKRDFAAARAAYAKLAARNEMTADTWADYADVVGSASGNSLSGQPATYIENALRLDPRQPKALWLQGSLQHETRQYAAAVATWQRLTAVIGSNDADAKLIAANLAEDQRLAGGAAPTTSATTAAAAAPASGVVRGEVVVADALRGKVPAGLTLFILAKSVNSPGAPVAILRLTTGTWPVSFQLDDTLAMMPERKLSTAGPVTIEARTSRSGQAMPAPGDFQGATAPLDPTAGKPVRVVIQRVIG